MQCSSPLASSGFNMLPASSAPSVLPAPTIVCSSSINSIILPSLDFTSLSTALSLSSNSPRNFAPAISAPRSSEKIVWFLRLSGTSPLTILSAKPSAMAVLPTPGSPIKQGLFLVLRESILITLRISSSLPITGSSLCSLARCTKSVPYFLSTSYVSSGLSLLTFWFPLMPLSASSTRGSVMFCSRNRRPTVSFGFSIKPNSICSTET